MKERSYRRRFVTRGGVSEEAKLKKRAIGLGILTLLLVGFLVIWGIPFLIRFAVFLGDLRSSSEPEVVNDAIPPLPPKFSFIPEATNSATISVSGFAEKGAKLDIYFNEELFVETVSDESGEFEVEKVNLQEGANTIFAYAFDEAGNESEMSKRIEIVYDSQPPKLEVESPKESMVVYDQRFEVKGKTDLEGVKVTVNDHVVMIEKEGQFTYPIDLAEGANKIKIIAEDMAGNKAESEATVTYKL